jgi:bis(5'-nucleosyl)-tetraphosphatase (symmetrical)
MVKLYKKYQKNGTVFLDTLRDAEKKTLLDLQEEDITYLQTLPYFLKIDALTIVHGGIPQGISLSKKLNDKDQKLLTQLRFYNKKYEPIPYDDIESRAKFWSEVYNGSDGFVVFGHHPFEQVKVEKHALGIDTGCVYGGTLTAVTFNYHDKKVQTGAYKLYRVKAEHNHFATFM